LGIEGRRQAAKDAAGQVPTVSFRELERSDLNFVYGTHGLKLIAGSATDKRGAGLGGARSGFLEQGIEDVGGRIIPSFSQCHLGDFKPRLPFGVGFLSLDHDRDRYPSVIGQWEQVGQAGKVVSSWECGIGIPA
jgi:hypothetical protein